MFRRIAIVSILLALLFASQIVLLFRMNGELKARIEASQNGNADLSRQLVFLKALPPGPPLPDLELSYLRMQTEITALRETGGTVASATVRGAQAGQSIITAAKRIKKTGVFSVPVAIEIKEYKYFEGLLEAIGNLNAGNTLFESLKYDNGLFINTRLFGRNANAPN